ncbi:MAG: type II toxin-antitoxin system RelE/ParE family toxin [Clostridiales bacterium]|nr:type II toxin-antitoxin system RelE/ParE family toxin [Clostridiales bacterium]
MAKIIYSPEALHDLENIGDYISKQLKNPTAALNTVNAIQDRIDKLKDFPLLGTPLSAIYDDIDVGDYRFLVCLKYLAFYRAVENGVYIDRVMYGRRDYITILFGERPQDETE